jgi:hypothetical protein
VAIVVVSLTASGKFAAPIDGAHLPWTNHRDQARREDRKPNRPSHELSGNGSANPLKSLLTVR